MESIKQIIEHLKEIAPFGALMTSATNIHQNKVFIQRLFEMSIVVAATGGMIYGILTTKFDVMEKSISEIKQDIKELRKDLYVPRGSMNNSGIKKGKYNGNYKRPNHTLYYAVARSCCTFLQSDDANKTEHRESGTSKNVFH